MRYLTSPVVLFPTVLALAKIFGANISWAMVFLIPISIFSMVAICGLLIFVYFSIKLMVSGKNSRIVKVPGGYEVRSK